MSAIIERLPKPGNTGNAVTGQQRRTESRYQDADAAGNEVTPEDIQRPGFFTHDAPFTLHGQHYRAGLYWHGYGKAKKDEPAPEVDSWICSPIHAIAQTANERDEAFGLLLRFRNSRGQWREWAMPLELTAGGGEELRRELLHLGMRIDVQAGRDLLPRWLMSRYPQERVTAALRTGWHDTEDARAFVLPGRTIGSEAVRFQSERAVQDDFRSAGSLNGWRDAVGKPCSGNPVLLLAVSAAFAGPLLKVAAMQEIGGAGLHLMGDTSRGKTTALQAAGSVWGAPGFVRAWRATGNGLEATAAGLNDTLLALDEISEADAREIGGIVYAIANGKGKQRAARTGGAREVARWRVMLLSSGERTLASHMGEAGKRPKGGQEVRLLDVPATGRAHGAFDVLYGHSPRGFADSIKAATAKHYGHAGPAFVEAMLADDSDFAEALAAFKKLEGFATEDSAEGRAASVFALLAMAGELATAYDITGWQEKEAREAAIWGFRAWRDFRGTGQTETRQICEAVRDFIERHGSARFSDLSAPDAVVRERAGYWKDDAGGRIWMFNRAALQEAAGGFPQRRVTEALEAAGWLAEHDIGRQSKVYRVGGGSVRLYAVRPLEPAS